MFAASIDTKVMLANVEFVDAIVEYTSDVALPMSPVAFRDWVLSQRERWPVLARRLSLKRFALAWLIPPLEELEDPHARLRQQIVERRTRVAEPRNHSNRSTLVWTDEVAPPRLGTNVDPDFPAPTAPPAPPAPPAPDDMPPTALAAERLRTSFETEYDGYYPREALRDVLRQTILREQFRGLMDTSAARAEARLLAFDYERLVVTGRVTGGVYNGYIRLFDLNGRRVL
jgi:hypothetical protein